MGKCLSNLSQAFTTPPQLLHDIEDANPFVLLDCPSQSVTQHANIAVEWSVYLSTIFLFRHESRSCLFITPVCIDTSSCFPTHILTYSTAPELLSPPASCVIIGPYIHTSPQ